MVWPEPASLRISLPSMADQEAVDVERQRLAVGHAGQPRALLLVDAEDDVVVAVEHAVGDRRDGEFADLLCRHAAPLPARACRG